MFFTKKEKIELKIQGMKCMRCRDHVEKALNEIDGVKAKVNLENKTAVITLSKSVGRDVLVKAVTDAGYSVVD